MKSARKFVLVSVSVSVLWNLAIMSHGPGHTGSVLGSVISNSIIVRESLREEVSL